MTRILGNARPTQTKTAGFLFSFQAWLLETSSWKTLPIKWHFAKRSQPGAELLDCNSDAMTRHETSAPGSVHTYLFGIRVVFPKVWFNLLVKSWLYSRVMIFFPSQCGHTHDIKLATWLRFVLSLMCVNVLTRFKKKCISLQKLLLSINWQNVPATDYCLTESRAVHHWWYVTIKKNIYI